MTAPMIHHVIQRDDLARLATELCAADPADRDEIVRALHSGEIDTLLDSPLALEIVRGSGGPPAPPWRYSQEIRPPSEFAEVD